MYILLRLILSWQTSCLSTLLHRSPKKKLFSEQNVFNSGLWRTSHTYLDRFLTCLRKDSQSRTPLLKDSPRKYRASSTAASSAWANCFMFKSQFPLEEKYRPCSNCLKTGAVAVTASLQSTGSPEESSFSLSEFILSIFPVDNFNSVSTISSSCFSFSMMLFNFVLPSFSFSPTLN